MLIEVAISLFLVWLTWNIFAIYMERIQLPPGPTPLPFIGNLYHLGNNPIASLEKLRDKYGDIYTVSFRTGSAVVINSSELAQEALKARKDDNVGRLPKTVYPLNFVFGETDLITSDYGPAHVFRRKVFKTALHVFGAGVGKAEERVGHAIQDLLNEIEALEGQPFSPKTYVATAMISELWNWLSAKKCSFDHPTVNLLLEFNQKWPNLYSPGSLNLIPMKYLPAMFKENLNRVIAIREGIFTPELHAHIETYKSGVIRDLTDSFLSAYMNEIAKESGKDIGSIEDVKGLMMDVIAGGVDTSSSFFAWFILYMLLNQNVQKKIHVELDREIGRERLPCWKDADKLHYLQATICEVMRHSSFVPYVIHSACRDTTIKGYKIPKGTSVYFNIFNIQRDSKQWSEAETFRPDRFLDSEGKFVGWTTFSGFLPFNIGRRACPGILLAKIQVFSLVSTLLHRFELELPDGEETPTLEYAEMFAPILTPKDYKIVAKKRM